MRSVLAGGLVAGLSAGMVAAAGSALASTAKQRIAPGVVYLRTVDPSGPQVIHVVRVSKWATASLDTVLAGSAAGARATTSEMAKADGGIVAINGDFGGIGVPHHAWAGDGRLVLSGTRSGPFFGFRADGTGASMTELPMRMHATDLARRPGGGIRIAGWNAGVPQGNQVRAYTSYGGSFASPPVNTCTARLAPLHRPRWGAGMVGVRRDYVVKAQRCGATPLRTRSGTIVLASQLTGRGATWIGSLTRYGTVSVRWSASLPDVLDGVGGHPTLVRDGSIVPQDDVCRLCGRNPRTAIGVTATGTILLVVVDGRSPSSVGMTLSKLASYMHSLGAVEALNLDGGGSSTLWIEGSGVVNDPSDGSERRVSNAVVVLPGSDPSEPHPR
jgi:hypothetical protein